MKISASEMAAPVNTSKWTVGVVAELVKARLTGLVLLTTIVGFYLGNQNPGEFFLLASTMLGTALLASGAASLNQYLEREHDARMPRTQDRPIPAGLVSPEATLIMGGVLSIVGILQLALFVNLLTSLLGCITLALYLFVYTPLKRVTTLNTVIGAVPGAVPPLMGWAAARGSIDGAGWSLFAILFFWQLPHFLAIAWMYRDEYGKAGYVMLPNVDSTGERTGAQALSHTFGLLPVSLAPVVFGVSGAWYALGAIVMTLVFVYYANAFRRELSRTSARRLFFCSIIYLPLLLGLMVFDKVG